MKLTPIEKLTAATLTALLLGDWLFWQASDGIISPSIHKSLPEIPEAARNDNFRLPALSVYQEITRRPLFTEARRPAMPAIAQTKAETDFIAIRIQVRSIVITSTERKALIYDSIENEQFYVENDSIIQGWRIRGIRPDGILVKRGAQASFLTLSSSRKVQSDR